MAEGVEQVGFVGVQGVGAVDDQVKGDLLCPVARPWFQPVIQLGGEVIERAGHAAEELDALVAQKVGQRQERAIVVRQRLGAGEGVVAVVGEDRAGDGERLRGARCEVGREAVLARGGGVADEAISAIVRAVAAPVARTGRAGRGGEGQDPVYRVGGQVCGQRGSAACGKLGVEGSCWMAACTVSGRQASAVLRRWAWLRRPSRREFSASASWVAVSASPTVATALSSVWPGVLAMAMTRCLLGVCCGRNAS